MIFIVVLKVLIVLAGEMRSEIEQHLSALGLNIYFADSISELSELLSEGNIFQVALIPASYRPLIARTTTSRDSQSAREF